jgi:hypothetical protein
VTLAKNFGLMLVDCQLKSYDYNYDGGRIMADKSIQECNQKCKAKYANWTESDLGKKLMELDSKENEFHIQDVPREGLIAKICAVECGLIEQGWRS